MQELIKIVKKSGELFTLTSRGVVASGANIHDNFLKLLNESR